jgi:hypothetical protein
MSSKESVTKQPFEVGYGKPPKATRFRKGQSGNPRGRKRSGENYLSIFKRLVTKQVRVSDNGVQRRLSFAEAIILKNYQAALRQDQTAMSNVFRLVEVAGELRDSSDPKVVGGYIFMPERAASEEEFEKEYGASIIDIPATT